MCITKEEDFLGYPILGAPPHQNLNLVVWGLHYPECDPSYAYHIPWGGEAVSYTSAWDKGYAYVTSFPPHPVASYSHSTSSSSSNTDLAPSAVNNFLTLSYYYSHFPLPLLNLSPWPIPCPGGPYILPLDIGNFCTSSGWRVHIPLLCLLICILIQFSIAIVLVAIRTHLDKRWKIISLMPTG